MKKAFMFIAKTSLKITSSLFMFYLSMSIRSTWHALVPVSCLCEHVFVNELEAMNKFNQTIRNSQLEIDARKSIF